MKLDETDTTTRILVVEDEAIIAYDLKRRLERLGHQVVGIADNGAEALEMAAATKPTLIFMDIVIQGPMDGIATAEELGRRIDVPVIFLTAHSDATTIERAKHARPYGYLIKPFEERELHTTIEMALYRHRSEATARLLLQAMSSATIGIAVIDAQNPEHHVILCNSAFEHLTGYTIAELREWSLQVLDGPDTDPLARAEIGRAMTEQTEGKATLVVHQKDGSPIWADVTISLLRNPVGEVTHFLFFYTDITTHKQTEAALLRAQKMEAIGRLTGGVAHDFNNILAIIRSFAGFVRDELPEGDPRRDDIVEILHAADRGAAITRQLLTFSRQRPSVRRPVDLNDSLANFTKVLCRTVGANIETQAVSSSRPAIVRMDPVQVDQVLLNLAVNARDAMPTGGRIQFAISHPAQAAGPFPPGRYVRISATDTGHGMDQAMIERIFEPFFTTKPVGKGTGLGLSTCFSIVKDAGGMIDVTSKLGKGTTFTIDLPVCDDPLDDEGQGTAAHAVKIGARILVVEDDDALRKAAIRILESGGYDVSEARDGDEAIQLLQETKTAFDLVVTDVVMPGRGGYAVVQHVKDNAPSTRALLTSGYLDQPPGATNGAGDTPLLWKPYSKAGLLRGARNALARTKDAQDPTSPAPPAGAAANDVVPPAEPARAAAEPQVGLEELVVPPDEGIAAAPAAPAAPDEPPGLPARRILLVDDEDAQQRAYARALVAAGFQVTAVNCAEEALDLIARDMFDTVITDIGLPGADGMTVLRAARKRDTDIPVLLITGAPSLETATMAIKMRAVGYLAKPFNLEQLVREVTQAVEAGDVLRLQRKLLSAHAGADAFLLDIAGTRRAFDAALAGLHMAFQPVVRCQGGSIFGYEALLRSNEPTLSTPPEVLAAAEALGRMEDVGRTVRHAIADTLAAHPERTETIFVNLHPSELRGDLLCAATEPLLPSAARIVLEVTERASLSMGPQLDEDIRMVREAGYRVAIDDLGEGYAGLSWLAHLKPDIAKIDMSLVRDVHRSPLKREIVESLIHVCRRAGITSLAEGVETVGEARMLTDLGCDLLQGYFFARPGPPFPEVQGTACLGGHA